MTINGTYTVMYLDSDGITRAHASGPEKEFKKIRALAKTMLEVYVSEPGHATREHDIEKYTYCDNYVPG